MAPTLLEQWLEAEGRKESSGLRHRFRLIVQPFRIWVNGHQTPRLEYRQRLQAVTGLPVADERACGRDRLATN
ncbi:MAG: hypothetical protein V9G14_02980 [Cypionkella sp.]